MSRAVMATLAAVLVGSTSMLAGCTGSSTHADPLLTPAACPLIAEMAATGATVARADVSDPVKFDTTLRSAVADYVKIAQRLQVAVPSRLRPDVEQLETAARQYRFADATAARSRLDAYARTKCSSPKAKT